MFKMNKIFEVPLISFKSEDYNKSKNEIFINLNDFRFLDNLINDYRISHRRLLPQINVKSPSGVIANFCYPVLEGYEIVFKGKKCNIRLSYK